MGYSFLGGYGYPTWGSARSTSSAMAYGKFSLVEHLSKKSSSRVRVDNAEASVFLGLRKLAGASIVYVRS